MKTEQLLKPCPLPNFYNHPAPIDGRQPYTKIRRGGMLVKDAKLYFEMNRAILMQKYYTEIATQITRHSPIILDLARLVTEFVPDMQLMEFHFLWRVCGVCENSIIMMRELDPLYRPWFDEFHKTHPFSCKCSADERFIPNEFHLDSKLSMKMPIIYEYFTCSSLVHPLSVLPLQSRAQTQRRSLLC
jgi:hypothetical protein